MLFSSKRKRVKLANDEIVNGVGGFDLENEFDDMGLDFETEPYRTPDGKATQIRKGFMRGFTDGPGRQHLLKGLLAGALPTEYTHLITAGEEAFKTIKRNVTRAQEDNADSLLAITNMVDRNFQRVKGRLSVGLSTRIEKKISAQREFYKELADKNDKERSPTNAVATQDAEALKEALADTFAVSDAIKERRDEERTMRSRIEDNLRDKTEDIRFGANLEVLQGMRDDIGRQVAYQDNYLVKYQRKQLEISYQQYFALRDLKKIQGAALEFTATAMDSLIHNTSLSESQKERYGVRKANFAPVAATREGTVNSGMSDPGNRGFSYANQLRRQMFNDSYKRYRSNLDNFTSEFWPKVEKSIQDNLRETLQGLGMAGEMTGGMGLGDIPPEMMGEEAGRGASSIMGRYLMPRLTRRFRPQMETVSRRLQGRNYLAAHMLNNAQPMLQDFAHNPEKEDSTLVGWMRTALRSQIPEYRLDNKLDDASYLQIDKAASFNNLTQRSIVEIIPGYLSRILHVQRQMWSGDDSIERETYDTVKGRFVTTKVARSELGKRIVTETQRSNIRSVLDEVMGNYTDGDTDALTDEAQYALRDRFMKDAARNGYFDPEAYIKGDFGEGTSDETREELINFFRGRFDFDDDGKLVKEHDNLQRLYEDSQTFTRIRDVIPNSQAEIARLHKIGNQEMLREMNLIYNEHGQDYINYDQLWTLYRGDDTFTPPTSGPAPEDPDAPKDEATGNVFKKRFTDKMAQFGFVDEFDPTHQKDTTPSPAPTPSEEEQERMSPATIRERIEKEAARMQESLRNTLPTSEAADTPPPSEPAPERGEEDLKAKGPGWKDRLRNWKATRDERYAVAKSHMDTEKLTEQTRQLRNTLNKFVSPDPTMTPVYRHLTGENTVFSGMAMRTPNWRHPFGLNEAPMTAEEHAEAVDAAPEEDVSPEAVVQAMPKPSVAKRLRSTWTDLYSKYGRLLVLKRDVRDEAMIDVNTKKRVENIEDITGPVVDKDGNFVITQEDYDRGLFDVHGKRQRGYIDNALSKNWLDPNLTMKERAGYVKDQAEVTKDKLKGGFKNPIDKTSIRHVKSFLKSFSRDAYLPGEEDPRIRVKVMKAGGYTDDKGKPLLHFDDFGTKTVYDLNGNVVVAYDELEHLVTGDGKPHRLAKNRGMMGFITRRARNMVRRYKDWSINYWKKLPGRALKVGGAALRPAKYLANRFLLGKKDDVGMMKRGWQGAKNMTRGGLSNLAEDTKRGLGIDKEDHYRRHPRGKGFGLMEEFGDIPERFRQDGDPTPAPEVMPEAPVTPPPSLAEEKHEPKPTLFDKAKRRMGTSRKLKWLKDEDQEVNRETLNTPTEALLGRINDTLAKQNEDEPRKGSWQQILADRQEAKEQEKASAVSDKAAKSLTEQFQSVFGGIGKALGGLGGLLGLGGGGGDTNIMAGNPADLLGGGNDKDKGKGGKRGGGGRRGWMKRTWDGVRGVSGGTRTGRLARGAGTAAMWLGRGLLMGAGAIASSPVLLTAAVGTAAVGGGYYLWKRHKQTSGKLYRHRFAQYGIDPTDRAQALPVLDLEAAVEPATRRGADGTVNLDWSVVDSQRILDTFGLDQDDEATMTNFLEWMNKRFYPIWMYHQSKLSEMGVEYTLSTIDKDITPDHAMEFLDLLKGMPNDAYRVQTSPFDPEKPLSMTSADVDAYYEEALAHYGKKSDPIGSHGNGVTRMPRRAEDATEEPDSDLPDLNQEIEEGEDGDPQSSGTSGARNPAQRSAVAQQAKKRDLSFLQKVRGHAYGLSHFDDNMLDAILSLEDSVLESVSIDSDGQAAFSGNADQYLAVHAEQLGIVVGGLGGGPGRRKYRHWFNNRFITVLLAYAAKAKELDPSLRLNGSGNQLTKAKQLEVARTILQAKKEGWLWDTSVWETETLDIPGQSPKDAELLARHLVDAFMASEQKPAVPFVPVPKREDEEEGVVAGRHEPNQEVDERPDDLLPQGSSMVDRWRQNAGLNRPSYGTAGIETPMRAGGPVSAGGAVYGGLLEGTGGAFEDVALPTANNSREAAMVTLRDVEKMTGVNAEILATFAKIESDFNYLAKNPDSSATGWFQFIDKTWKSVLRLYGSKYGIPSNLSDEARNELKKDPRINALMGAELLKENITALKRKTGRDPTDTELYLAHFMGGPRAGEMLSAPDTNVVAAHAYPDSAAANESVFWQGGRALTVGEIIAWADGKVAPGRSGNGSVVSLVNSHHTPDEVAQPTPTPTTGSGGVPHVPDPTDPDIVDPDIDSPYAPSTPASHGPTDVSLYDSAQAEVAADTETSTPGAAGSGDVGDTQRQRAFARVENHVDPYGPQIVPNERILQARQPDVEVDEAAERREQIYQEARTQDLQQQERSRTSREEQVEMGTVAQQQLVTQQSMLTYLEKIASTLGVIEQHVEPEEEPRKPLVDPPNATGPKGSTSTPPKRGVPATPTPQKREPAGVSMNR